jgi:two-component system NarL family sensor kinase
LTFVKDYIERKGIYTAFYIAVSEEISDQNRDRDIFRTSVADPGSLPDTIVILDLHPGLYDDPPRLTIYAPLKKSGRIIAVLELEIDMSTINAIMLEKGSGTGLGASGESYLVGSDFLMRSSSRFSKNSIMNIEVKTPGVKEALAGVSATDVFPDYRGIEVLSSYCKPEIPNLDWVLMAEIDLKEAMAPINEIRNNILFVTVSISAAVFVIAYFVSKRFARPLYLLTKATEKIGEGDFEYKVDVESKDEIGDLAKSFNLMGLRLKEKSEELEKERLKRYSISADAQEEERERLSRELHDGIGQTFIAIKFKIEQVFDRDDLDKELALNEISDNFNHAIDEIRRISNNLSPSILKEFGLRNAVRKLCDDMEEILGIRVDFQFDFDDSLLDKKQKTYLYRIVQEAFNNVQKHSDAENVVLRFIKQTGFLFVEICDDGSGFKENNYENANGAGLVNIKERAKILDGKARIESAPEGGVKITVRVPIVE